MRQLKEKIEFELAKYRLTFSNEFELQNLLADIFKQANIEYEREFQLTKKDRPDFLILPDGYAVEVKVGGSIDSHLRQMKRYNNHAAVLGTILIGTRPYSMPDTLSGKPVALINVGGNRL